MAVQANALTTTVAMRRYLNISDASEDTRLEGLINGASTFFETYTRRLFLEATYTDDVYDSTGISSLLLTQPVDGEFRALPVTVLTSLSILGSLIDATTYQPNKRAGIITLHNQVFFGGRGDVKVTWVGGYILQGGTVTPPQRALPPDIEQAVKELVALKYRIETKQLGPGLQSVSAAGESVSYSDDGLPNSIKDVLREYTVAVY